MAGRLYTNEPVGDREPIDSMSIDGNQHAVDRVALALLRDGYDIYVSGKLIVIYNRTAWELIG